MYQRQLKKELAAKFHKGKAIVLMGPRQVGKTTLIQGILEEVPHLFLDADDPTTRELLTQANTQELRAIIGEHTTVFLDEAQRIDDIGLTLKIITDQFKDAQLIVSGSSSLDLSGAINEPLTGRKWEYELLPISWQEYEDRLGYLDAQQQLENRLLYGMYPDVLNHEGEEKAVLKNLVSSYLFKDILAHAGLQKPEVLDHLVQALALQLGNEVNYNELSQTVGVDKNTVQRYIELLEKTFVIHRLRSYSGNVRNEIKRGRKIYFYDNGVRNMVIGNFSPLDIRQDKGALWENFLMAERIKYHSYRSDYTKMYFWRTTQQQEVDLVESEDGQLRAFEFKWKSRKGLRLPKTFTRNYEVEGEVVDNENFREFVMDLN